MGSKISIDKYVSNLEDILEIAQKNLHKLNFESQIPESVVQHIKVIYSFSWFRFGSIFNLKDKEKG